MKDINTALTTKLYNLLQPVVGVPVYSKYIPANLDVAAYLLLTTITSLDSSTMTTFDSEVSVQIGIYTKDTQANSGAKCNAVAQLVYDTLLPTVSATIDLEPDFDNYSLTRVNDVSPDVIVTPAFVFINRVITFRLGVFHRS